MRYAPSLVALCLVAIQLPAWSEEPLKPKPLADRAEKIDAAVERMLGEVREIVGPEFSVHERLEGKAFMPFSVQSLETDSEPILDIDPAQTPPQTATVSSPDQFQQPQNLKFRVQEFIQRQRDLARDLEQLAADAENLNDFQLADTLRSSAKEHWELARSLWQSIHQPSQFNQVAPPPANTTTAPPQVKPYYPGT